MTLYDNIEFERLRALFVFKALAWIKERLTGEAEVAEHVLEVGIDHGASWDGQKQENDVSQNGKAKPLSAVLWNFEAKKHSTAFLLLNIYQEHIINHIHEI
jgi:hypothetical protein